MYRHGHATRSGGRSKKLTAAAVEVGLKVDPVEDVVGVVEETTMEDVIVSESNKLVMPTTVNQAVVEDPAAVGMKIAQILQIC